MTHLAPTYQTALTAIVAHQTEVILNITMRFLITTVSQVALD